MERSSTMNNAQKNMRAEGGFTLVELAIVMIIIGLLIAGVLKGQALINNAQVTATVAQMKATDAATTTFKDTYAALPGNIQNPGTRLPNGCNLNALCNTGGTGNGNISNLPNLTPVGAEGERFFVHLNAAGLITGIVPGVTGSLVVGQNFPATKISNNVVLVGGTTTGAAAGFATALGSFAAHSAGTYLIINQAIGVPGATVGLMPDQALRIDTKLDDGVPDTGQVIGIGTVGIVAGNCGSTSGATPGQYATINSQATCGLYIHIQ
jgi:prepilin-type N-terminal cleavage/methylation domain-containing protein